MALGDYHLCAVCLGKTFYDANVPWDDDREEYQGSGQSLALCLTCVEKFELLVVTIGHDGGRSARAGGGE